MSSDAPVLSVLRLCSNRAGYEVVPERRLSLDLADVEKRAVGAGFEPLANAGIILVLRWGALEVSVFESGKLLFKTRELPVAEAGLAAFREAMGWR